MVCEVCHKQIDEDFIYIQLVRVEDHNVIQRLKTKHICCNQCLPLMKVALSEITFRQPARLGKELPLDHGKMVALRKAGWTYKQIADEMGCAANTISEHLKKIQKEEK